MTDRTTVLAEATTDLTSRMTEITPSEVLAEKLRRGVSHGPSGCWEWQGYRGPSGYGVVRLPGRGKVVRAHRAAWVQANGPIPDGLVVCHRCDNRACCNPEHLFVDTQEANMADMVTKGRVRGERHGQARLTDAQVADIRRRYVPGQTAEHPGSSAALGAEHGVSAAHIIRLGTGRKRGPR